MATDEIRILIKAEIDDALKGLKKVGDDNESMLDKFKKNWLAVAGVATSVLIAIKKAFDFAKEFAEFKQASDAMSQQFGKNANEVIKKLKEVSAGTIANKDLVLAANRAMALGVTQDINKIAGLLEYARLRARAMGTDTTSAFNDIVTGIGRQSPLILDNLGIITKGWAEEAKAAKQSYDVQFILNKVLQQGQSELGRTGKMSLTSAEEIQVFSTNLKNIKVSIGKYVLPAFEALFAGFNKLITVLKPLKEMSLQEKLLNVLEVKKYNTAFEKLNGLYNNHKILIKDLNSDYAIYSGKLENVISKQMEYINASKEIPAALLKEEAELRGIVKAYEDTLNGIAEKKEALAKREIELAEERKKLQKEINDLDEETELEKLQKKKDRIDELLTYQNLTEDMRIQLKAERDSVELEMEKVKTEEKIKLLEKWKDAAFGVINGYSDLYSALSDRRIAQMKKETDNHLQKLKEKKEKGQLTEEEYAKEVEKTNKNLQRETAIAARKVAIVEKTAKVLEIIANTGLAVMKSYALSPETFGAPWSVAAGAAGALQTAAVLASPLPEIPAFAKGGSFLTNGPQMIMVGDNPGGKERVDITPMNTDNRRQFSFEGANIQITANNPDELLDQLQAKAEDMGTSLF